MNKVVKKPAKAGGILFYSEKKWLAIIGIFSFLLFANTIPNNYNLDDELVTINHRLTSKGVSAIPEIFSSPYYSDNAGNAYEYRPVTLATFAIEHQLFGDNPHISHFFNVVLYALTCMVLFICLLKLFKEYNILFPLFTTLLFAAHPLHTEVVAGIKNRDEILCLLSGLSALLFSLKFSKKGKLIDYILFLLLFVIALLSKRSILPFVVIIPLTLIFFTEIKLKYLCFITIPLAISGSLFWPFEQLFEKAFLAMGIFLIPVGIFFLKEFMGSSDDAETKNDINGMASQMSKNTNPSRIVISQLILLPVIMVLSATLIYYNSVSGIILTLIALVCLYVFSGKNSRHWIYTDILILLGSVSFFYKIEGLPILLLLTSIVFFFIEKLDWKRIVNILLSIVIVLLAQKHDPWVFVILALPFAALFYYFFKKNKTLYGTVIFFVFTFFEGIYFSPVTLKGIVIIGVCVFLFFLHFTKGRFEKYTSLLFVCFSIPIVLAGFMMRDNTYLPGFEKKNFQTTVNEIAASEVSNQIVPSSGRELNFVEMPLKDTDPLSIRAGTSFLVLGNYLKLMIFPYPLGFYYGYATVKPIEWTDWHSLLSLVFYLGLIIASIAVYKAHPIFTYGVFFYIISISVFSNFLAPVAGIMGDRLAFVASAGFCIAFAYGLLLLLKVKIKDTVPLPLFDKKYLIAVSVLLIFTLQSFSRNFDWKNHLTLFRTDIKHLENSVQANNLLAAHLIKESFKKNSQAEKEKLLNEAVIYFNKAVEIYPKADFAWYDLGQTYKNLNRPDDALVPFLKVTEIDPSFKDAWKEAGIILTSQRKYAQAIICFKNTLNLDSSKIEVYASLSEVYFLSGDKEKSIEINLLAANKFPNSYEPLVNIGKTYFTSGDKKNALLYFEKAFSINSSDKNLVLTIAEIYKEIGDKQKAEYYNNIGKQM